MENIDLFIFRKLETGVKAGVKGAGVKLGLALIRAGVIRAHEVYQSPPENKNSLNPHHTRALWHGRVSRRIITNIDS